MGKIRQVRMGHEGAKLSFTKECQQIHVEITGTDNHYLITIMAATDSDNNQWSL